MIIIPIRSICLLLLTNSILSAEEITLSLEVMQVPKEQISTMKKEAQDLQKKGFDCHIDTKKDILSLRCNDTKSMDELQKSMNAFNENNIDYTIIYKTLNEEKHYKDPRIFYLGYQAYDKGEYQKALNIFEYNYNKMPNLEHGYAYALTLMKIKRYNEALEVLKNFSDTAKAKKLTTDIARTHIDELVHKEKYQEAHTIVKKYMNDEKSSHTIIAIQHYNKLLALKQYDQAKVLAEEYNLSEKSDEAAYMSSLVYFEQKEYRKALDILANLDNLPKAKTLYDDILYTEKLDQAWELLDHDHTGALTLFKQACELKDSVSCKKGMMYAHYKNKNYNQAYTIAEELYTLEKNDEFASMAMYSAKALKKTDDAGQWYTKIQNKKGITDPNVKLVSYDPRSKIKSYIDKGDKYRKQGDLKALNMYKQAKSLDKTDINLEVLYLYALKDFKKYILLDEELHKAYQMYPQHTKTLNHFKQVYQNSRLNEYYQDKQYQKCLEYEKEIKDHTKDDETYRITGWCAYALENYDKAKKQFENITPNSTDIYAYALSSYKNGDLDEAIDIVSTIEAKNDSERIKIAALYSDLSMQEKAQELLKKLPESIEKETLTNRINKNYFYTRYDHTQSIGLDYRTRSTNSGKNSFNTYSLPFDYDYVDPVKKYHLYLEGDILRLSTTNIDTNTNFGFNTTSWEENKKREFGLYSKIGINYKNINAEIGFSPIGYDIDPKLLWLLSYTYNYEKTRFNIAFTQKEIDDTMLSYVGEKTIHPDSDETVYWGRVLKQGYSATISHDMDQMILALNMEYYPKIHGENVMNNKEFKTTAMMLYFPNVEYFSFMQIGLLANYDSYDKNSDLYSYGHGGYFSPQDFWLGSIFTQFGDKINENFYYQSKLSIGYQWYEVDDVNIFPLDIDNNLVQEGYKKDGISYTAAIQLGYKLTDNIDIVAGLSIEKMKEYKENRASFTFTYKFKPSKHRYINTFKMNHRFDQLMR